MFTYEEQIKQFALKQPKAGKDVRYNRGRKDCINNNPWSEGAKYFVECCGYTLPLLTIIPKEEEEDNETDN